MVSSIPFNKLHNLSNPYQGTSKRVLCVCSAGLLRSPTAANVLHQELGYNTRACGINPEYALIGFDDALANWADEIVAVHPDVAGNIPKLWASKVTVLNIPDIFAYDDEELKRRILAQYKDTHNEYTGLS